MQQLSAETLNASFSLLTVGLIHWQARRHGKSAFRPQERIGLFDVLKGLCIIAVVGIHTAYLTPIRFIIYRSLDFAVPIFFISSGYLLSVKNNGRIDLAEYFRKIFLRILLIYIIFVVGMRVVHGEEISMNEIALDALLGRTNNNYYFIPLILQFYILFPSLIRLRARFGNLFFFCAVALTSFFFKICNNYIQQPNWNSSQLYLIFVGRDLVYFCFGIFLSQYDIWKSRFSDYLPSFGLFLAGATFFTFSTNDYCLTYAYPFVAFIFALVVYNAIRQHCSLALVGDLGRYSLVIYLVHSVIQHSFVMQFLYDETLPWALNLVIVVTTTVLLSYAFAKVFMNVYQNTLATASRLTKLAR